LYDFHFFKDKPTPNSRKLVMTIKICDKQHLAAIPNLILNIQQNEFGVPITLADQPDLLDIPNFYQKDRGQFWVAENDSGEVVGTIALIDVGADFGTIRKMFVRADHRGKEQGIGQKLYDTLEQWALTKGFKQLMLGTRDQLQAALRFYERNGYQPVLKENLPERFPLMAVDNRFYAKTLAHPVVRRGTTADIAGVLALQSRYLYTNLTEAERLQGFVTTPFTTEQIERVIAEEQGLYVADWAGTIVGYAYGASWDYWSAWEMFRYMISRLPVYQFQGQALTVANTYQYGPICVDAQLRGHGVAEGLFAAVRAGFGGRYPIGLTFINKVNELSLAFHTRKLGLEIVDDFSFNGKHYFALGFVNRPH
jgi:GNAT superfamily N-acetyltransferase